jgi:general stress protein 26
LRELIDDIAVAMVTTVTPDGTLHSRPMLTQGADEEGVLWFFTSTESDMAHDLEEEHAVNISYADPGTDRYVSVSGQANLEKERSRMEDLWEPVLNRYFARGLEDPNLALMKVRIESAEYWDPKSSKMIPVRQAHHTEPHRDQKDGNAAQDEGEHTKIDIRAARSSG